MVCKATQFQIQLMYRSQRTRWVMGLVLIILLYTLFYLLFADRAFTYTIPRKLRHIIKFATTIAVYLIGTYHLGKLQARWMSHLWHFIHITLLATITGIGIYDWTFGMVSYRVKELAATMQEFLISPVLYVAMGILNRKVDVGKQNTFL